MPIRSLILSFLLLILLSACSEPNGIQEVEKDGDQVEFEENRNDGDLEPEAMDDESVETEAHSDFDVIPEKDLEFETEAENEADIWEEKETEPETEFPYDSPLFARVFEVNPVTTPEPVPVLLADLAEDQDGSLISRADPDGCRKLRVVSCVDEGETNTINVGAGWVTQKICSLHALADNMTNGNFDYSDWAAAIDGTYNPSDIHAEVELYYHAQKFYGFLTQPEVGLWEKLPLRHEMDSGFEPLLLVANYRLPNSDMDGELTPISMAMFVPEEYRAMGMGAVYGLTGYKGDALIFGQGPKADFAYDGETIYHEFGHWVNYALAGLTNDTIVDEYGLSNLRNALEQGISETFVFLVSGRTRFFEYLDHVASPGFIREVANQDHFPDHLNGFDQTDGLIVAGANVEAYETLNTSYSIERPRFARILLNTLIALKSPDLHSFPAYTEAFCQQVETEIGPDASNTVREIMVRRGLFSTERAKDISAYTPEKEEVLYFDGAINKPWNTFILLNEGGTSLRIATATVQNIVTIPEPAPDTITIEGILGAMPDPTSMYPAPDDWKLALFMRKGEAVRYETQDDMSISALRDMDLAPTLTTINTPQGERLKASWTLNAPEAGARYYLHLVNKGDSPGVLMAIGVRY